MSKHTNDLYDNIELVPDDPDNITDTVIIDKEDSEGFDVNWDKVERDYSRHNHHHSGSGHHSHHSDSGSTGHHSSSESKKHSSDTTDNKNSLPSKKKNKKKWSRKKKILIGILLAFLIIIIGLISAFFIMRYIGKQKLLNYANINLSIPEDIDYENNGKIIYYKGHTYQFNENIASVLFMGIDNRELAKDDLIGNGGQADALYLFTYDTSSGRIRVLCLNRDTMTDISRYDSYGIYQDTVSTQLCLAYAFGDGQKSSAQNQVTAVQRLIYNIPINAYYAIDLSAIKILNDDIGGVTLTPEYTFGSFTKGQKITIKGDMAEEFVRHRDTSLVDDNLRRMACQRLYITSFANQVVPAIKNDLGVPMDLYRDSSKYTVTNIDLTEITYMASTLAMDYTGMDLITTSGKYKMVEGDASAEYILDKDAFFETILSLYYIQIK